MSSTLPINSEKRDEIGAVDNGETFRVYDTLVAFIGSGGDSINITGNWYLTEEDRPPNIDIHQYFLVYRDDDTDIDIFSFSVYSGVNISTHDFNVITNYVNGTFPKIPYSEYVDHDWFIENIFVSELDVGQAHLQNLTDLLIREDECLIGGFCDNGIWKSTTFNELKEYVKSLLEKEVEIRLSQLIDSHGNLIAVRYVFISDQVVVIGDSNESSGE